MTAENGAAGPLVSVVTIFHDEERFLPAAAESVLAQTYGRWELLLVDDGSTDRSAEIARALAHRDPGRVRSLAHPGHANLGMSASRNLGVREARGELIALLDADDVWLPAHLERQVEALARHPGAAMVFGPTRLWFSWAGEALRWARDPLRDPGVETEVVVEPPSLAARLLRDRIKAPAICSILVRAQAVRDVGGWEPAFRGLFEDQVFLAKILLEAPVVAIDECLDLYRQHPSSACYAARYEGLYHGSLANPEHRAFLRWLERWIAQRGIHDADVDAALAAWLAKYEHPLRARLADLWHRPAWQAKAALRGLARATLPDPAYRWVWSRWQGFTRAHEEPRR